MSPASPYGLHVHVYHIAIGQHRPDPHSEGTCYAVRGILLALIPLDGGVTADQ